jgi:hypothetical protein
MVQNLVLVLFLAFGCVEYAHSVKYTVNNSTEFYAKLKLIKGGDEILFGDVTFDGRTSTPLVIKNISGNTTHPIRLTGSTKTLITNSGYGLYFVNCNYWILNSNFQKFCLFSMKSSCQV